MPGREGSCREPLPNTTQARIDKYPRCIHIGLDTYQNALFLQSSIEKPLSTCPERTLLRLTRVHERIFCGILPPPPPPENLLRSFLLAGYLFWKVFL